MQRYGVRGPVLAVATTAALTAHLRGCSHDNTPSGIASQAASAVSRAGEAPASATAEAGRKFDEFSSPRTLSGDVTAGVARAVRH